MADSKRRRVNKACYFCNKSHLQCGSERPCERCKSRNIANMCRDAEDDLHGIYRKYQSQASAFHQELRARRGLFPDKAGVKAEAGVAPADAKQGERKWLSYLDDGIVMRQPLPSNPNGSQSIFSMQLAGYHDQENPLLHLVLKKREGETPERVRLLLKHILGADLFTPFLHKNLPEAADEACSQMVPSNLKLVEALALCDEKDLGELVQTLECQVLNLRKYLADGFPSLVWRRNGQLCMVTDELAEMLGYRKEEIIGEMHIFDLVALDEVPTMLVDVWIPCIGAGKAETIAFSSALVRRNGGILPVRGTLRILFGLRNIPLIAVMCVAPLQAVESEIRQPSMEVISSWFSIPASREMMTLGETNPLFAALDPTTGIASGEEYASLLTWF